jgi:Flp pilus assembly protein TadG
MDAQDRTGTCSSRGQGAVEFALVLPFLVLLALGVLEISFLLLDQHIVSRMTREGSNLISRDEIKPPLSTLAASMQSMANRPVDFSGSNSKLIFSVLTTCGTGSAFCSSGSNSNHVILLQRYELGTLAASSKFLTLGSIAGAFKSAPYFDATNPGNNTNLQITNVPSNLTINAGQIVYVTEIYSRHPLITPLGNFGIRLPSTLYSIAYF